MIPYIAQCERAEDGIGDSVQSNVCVGVAVEAKLARNRLSAELERPTRPKSVNIKSLTDAHAFHDTDPIIARTTRRSAPVVTLGFG